MFLNDIAFTLVMALTCIVTYTVVYKSAHQAYSRNHLKIKDFKVSHIYIWLLCWTVDWFVKLVRFARSKFPIHNRGSFRVYSSVPALYTW